MKICPKCEARYDNTWSICFKDNTQLFCAEDAPGDLESAPKEMEFDAPRRRATPRELKGVGGWLAFFIWFSIVVSVLGIFLILFAPKEQLISPSGQTVPILPDMLVYFKISVVTALAVRICSCIFLLRSWRHAVLFAQVGLVLHWIALSATQYIPRVFAVGKIHTSFIGTSIGILIWVIYLAKSKRVRNTYAQAEEAAIAAQ
jgi:hypothetical protein